MARHNRPSAGALSRRRLVLTGAGALLLAACGPAATPAASPTPSAPTPAPAKPTEAPKPTAEPTKPAAAPSPTGAPAAATKPAAPPTQPAATPTTAAASPTPAAQPAAGAKPGASLIVYSGRAETLVKPILERFANDTNVEVKARYGDTSALAAAILEEGKNSPADVYFAQDAGALGAVALAGHLIKLPDALLTKVEERFRSPKGEWVGLSGRARVLNYNAEKVKEADLPDSVQGLTDPKWKDQVGWAPTNGSFQAFVTAMRLVEGDEKTAAWLRAMKANGAKSYANNNAQVEATGKGEILVSTPNHYYVYSFYRDRGENFPAKNYHPRGGGPDAMINVAGAGILGTSRNREAAERWVEYMLSPTGQQYYADQTFEYPLIPGVKTPPQLKPLDQIKTPKIDLGALTDLRGTLKLLQDTGVV
jgi:iron(III) transport system substrate-binding protein